MDQERHPAEKQPSRLLVTFIVSEEGEPLRPFTESVAVVALDDAGEPVSFDSLNQRVARAIRARRTNNLSVSTEA